jgi:hypothetical protein
MNEEKIKKLLFSIKKYILSEFEDTLIYENVLDFNECDYLIGKLENIFDESVDKHIENFKKYHEGFGE